jgi:acetyl-CoA C-acetyltransferase
MSSPRPDVFILGAARTPIGKYGGALRRIHPAELGATAVRAVLSRSRVSPDLVDEIHVGHARQAGSGPNPARQVGRRAGIPDRTPAQTINKACASGMQAVASAAQGILLGEASIALAGGIESMSRMPYFLDAEDARWGHRMGSFRLVDAMYRDGFECALSGLVMGETAEILARQYGITRAASDAFAFESQARARRAIEEGRFDREIAPVAVEGPKGTPSELGRDEHPRFDTTLDSLAKLPLVFGGVDGAPGVITAGSSSGVTDGGAAVLLAGADAVERHGLTTRARVIGWASAGVDPRVMGIGPVPAVERLLARTGLKLEDFDLVEINEAFAAQVLAVLADLPVPLDRLNVNGGAIALGHPIGCSGARILVTLLHELERRHARRGLATLCVSGGMGMAMAIERI